MGNTKPSRVRKGADLRYKTKPAKPPKKAVGRRRTLGGKR